MRIRNLVITLMVAFAATPVCAGPISTSDWNTFVTDSYSQYGDADADDFEDQLYQAATHTKTQAAALADFANRMKLDPARAQADAALVVHMVVNDNTCESHCEFAPGTPLYEEALATAAQEPDGKLLLWLGKQIDEGDTAAFIRLAWNHPQAAAIFAELLSYNEKSAYLVATLLKLPDDPSGIPLPQLKGAAFSGAPDEMDGLVPAVLDASEARLADVPGSLAWRAALAQVILDQDLTLGLDQDAVAHYLAYPDALRAQLPYTPAGLTGNQLCRQADASYLFGNRLAAALWREGKTAEAADVLAHVYPADWKRDGASQTALDIVRDAMTPAIADKDLFSLYIEGRPKPDNAAAKPAGGDCSSGVGGMSGDGWLFATAREAPAVRQLVADRLARAGYTDMAAWLNNQTVFNDWNSDAPVLSHLSDLLPADVIARQSAWASRIAALKAAEQTSQASSAPVHVVATHLTPPWTEKPLPEGVAAWGGKAAPTLPKTANLPVPADNVIRYEGKGDEATLIYESADFDLPGEVPAYGLWMAQRRAGKWQRQVYLGLQQYFPYVATVGSRLPLINGDHLNLEVQVREIDPKTITFPPVALGYRREASGLYLDMALADLAADSDGDGMTDIEEARLGLKPDNADSDGDGIRDDNDAVPLTAYDPNANPATKALARIILQHLVGHDAGAIVLKPREPGDDPILGALGGSAPKAGGRYTVFVVSDTDVFSGIADAPFRLVVYSSEDLKQLGRDKTPFYPPRIINIFRSLDGDSYYVNWSASWVGGAFLVHCNGDDCTSKSLSDWIT